MARIYATVLMVLLATGALLSDDRVPPNARPITSADAVFAIYHLEGWVAKPQGPQLVIVGWGDGRVIWSEDRIRGGAPYRSGQIEPQRVARLLAEVEHREYFADESLNRRHVGYDASSTVILVKSGKIRVLMESMHEHDYGWSFAVSKFKKESPEYLHFRLAWAELRNMLTAMIPSESKPIDGRLFGINGQIYWLPMTPPDK